ATRAAQDAVLPPADAGCTLAGEFDAFDQTACFKPEVLPVEHRLQEAARRRPAPAAPLIDMKVADALVAAGVRIGNVRDAVLIGGVTECLEYFPLSTRKLDAPLATDGVVFTVPEEMIDVLPEDRPHVVPRPAGESKLTPVIVIAGLAEHVDHAVDR